MVAAVLKEPQRELAKVRTFQVFLKGSKKLSCKTLA
jgi:hypothetical protein